MAFCALTGTIAREAWLLLVANLIWTVAYDTLYAMVDREDDLKVGVKSTAILFGDLDRAFVAGMQIAVLLVLALVAARFELGTPFYIGLLAAALLFAWQQVLIANREPAACFRAFLNNNWVGAAIFAGLLIDYW